MTSRTRGASQARGTRKTRNNFLQAGHFGAEGGVFLLEAAQLVALVGAVAEAGGGHALFDAPLADEALFKLLDGNMALARLKSFTMSF